ncbi:MAG: alkaline phosphatase family protein [Oscillospiraceae bacterium]|jgi:hypothetical protein
MEYDDRPCITGINATICSLLGIPCHEGADIPIEEVLDLCRKNLGGDARPRVVMYNPDAIGEWIFRKYSGITSAAAEGGSTVLMKSVHPSITPACFGSMYTGVTPDVHGIHVYRKPVLRIPTVFDDIVNAGLRAAIVSTENDSISRLFLERKIDYFIYPHKEQCNLKAEELIRAGIYDLIVVYNGDYDHWMHRTSPEGKKAINALKENVETYIKLRDACRGIQGPRRTAIAFAPDHGCHRFLGFFGLHGSKKACDMEICHIWSFV